MQKWLLFISLLFSFSYSLNVFSCELPKGEKLRIGCSFDCRFFYRFRLNLLALKRGYSLEFVDLRKEKDLGESLKAIDGILLPGGADIHPLYYLDSVSSDLREYTKKHLHLVKFSKEGTERDPFEYSLVKKYSEDESLKNVPMLGICRGMQMMAVAQGIPLYLDIKTELGIRNRYNRFDQIEVVSLPDSTSSSLMYALYSDHIFKGFKLHHQGIRVPYYDQHSSDFPLARVSAYSNDGKIAEALEYLHRPALGVQFHPERSFSEASDPILGWFLKKSCEKKYSSLSSKLMKPINFVKE
jgi:gamma-glutamyl-gamma-aminobutyrate hydrolase PuuD